jgi:hypothetical protein
MIPLGDRLLYFLRVLHPGRENAVTRHVLLNVTRAWGYDVNDRDLRECYAELPVVTCAQGIYYPIRAEELAECRAYYRKAALTLLGRWRRIAQGHPDLVNAEQGNLFSGIEEGEHA